MFCIKVVCFQVIVLVVREYLGYFVIVVYLCHMLKFQTTEHELHSEPTLNHHATSQLWLIKDSHLTIYNPQTLTWRSLAIFYPCPLLSYDWQCV